MINSREKRSGASDKTFKVSGKLINPSYAESLGWDLELFKQYVLDRVKKEDPSLLGYKKYTIVSFDGIETKRFLEKKFEEIKDKKRLQDLAISNFDCYQDKRKIKLISKNGNVEIYTDKEFKDIKYFDVPYNMCNCGRKSLEETN